MTATLTRILLFQATQPSSSSNGSDLLWILVGLAFFLGLLWLTRRKPDPPKKQEESSSYSEILSKPFPEQTPMPQTIAPSDRTLPKVSQVSEVTKEDIEKHLANWSSVLLKDMRKQIDELLRGMSTRGQDWGMFLSAVRQSAEISNLKERRRDPESLLDFSGVAWIKSPELILVEGLCSDFRFTRSPASVTIYETMVKKEEATGDGECLMLCFEHNAEHDSMGYLSINYDKTKIFSLKDIQGFDRRLEANLERPLRSPACEFIGDRDSARIIWVKPGLIRRNTVGSWEIIRPVIVEYL